MTASKTMAKHLQMSHHFIACKIHWRPVKPSDKAKEQMCWVFGLQYFSRNFYWLLWSTMELLCVAEHSNEKFIQKVI